MKCTVPVTVNLLIHYRSHPGQLHSHCTGTKLHLISSSCKTAFYNYFAKSLYEKGQKSEEAVAVEENT